MQTVFLLSPAKVSGVRAGLLLNPLAGFALAREFQRTGLPLADVFAFASGLYFRGKIAYARRFTRSAEGDAIRVITPNAGLIEPTAVVTPQTLRKFGSVDIHESNPRYHGPLRRDAEALAQSLRKQSRVVLLGSIATAKYREVLLDVFGRKLMFPAEFVGRGDMSRGALLLRAAAKGEELSYLRVDGAVLTGKRARRIADMS